jgi:hypothetical protein
MSMVEFYLPVEGDLAPGWEASCVALHFGFLLYLCGAGPLDGIDVAAVGAAGDALVLDVAPFEGMAAGAGDCVGRLLPADAAADAVPPLDAAARVPGPKFFFDCRRIFSVGMSIW